MHLPRAPCCKLAERHKRHIPDFAIGCVTAGYIMRTSNPETTAGTNNSSPIGFSCCTTGDTDYIFVCQSIRIKYRHIDSLHTKRYDTFDPFTQNIQRSAIHNGRCHPEIRAVRPIGDLLPGFVGYFTGYCSKIEAVWCLFDKSTMGVVNSPDC